MRHLKAIECLEVVALSVVMFGVALVSSMCWLGCIYRPTTPYSHWSEEEKTAHFWVSLDLEQ
jgi:hypothetical protein